MMIDHSRYIILIMFDVKLTPSGRSVDRRYSYEWIDGMQDWFLLAYLVSARG